MKKQLTIFLMVLLGLVLRDAYAEEPVEVDHLSIASRLVQDGHYERARSTLGKVDLKNKKTDKKLFYVLDGLVALQQKRYADSVRSFKSAIKHGDKRPLVQVNLSRAYFGLENYKRALGAMQKAGPTARDNMSAELLLSRIYWELRRPSEALAVLGRARPRFSSSIEVPRLELSYLVKLNLFQELALRRADFLKREDVIADDIGVIAEALRQSGQLGEARSTLEAGRVRFPNDIALTVQLARVYMDQGKMLSSAILLEEAARLDPAYLVETAELYRRAGRLTRALLINARVSDQRAKMKQRLQLLLELDRFESVAAMESRLTRLELLNDEQIRYALAYAMFQIREFEASEAHLKKLSDPTLFKNGAELRKAMAECKSAGWNCE